MNPTELINLFARMLDLSTMSLILIALVIVFMVILPVRERNNHRR